VGYADLIDDGERENIIINALEDNEGFTSFY
jgi:hypothetical protein